MAAGHCQLNDFDKPCEGRHGEKQRPRMPRVTEFEGKTSERKNDQVLEVMPDGGDGASRCRDHREGNDCDNQKPGDNAAKSSDEVPSH